MLLDTTISQLKDKIEDQQGEIELGEIMKNEVMKNNDMMSEKVIKLQEDNANVKKLVKAH